MKERGQVFTLDMFFALTLAALVVSYSGLALEQEREQAESYALRYSLERVANDAADVLVKTLGEPINWWENTETLETLGLVEENEGNPVQNALSIMRFGQFRRLTNRDNWLAPVNANAVEAIKKLFGGSEDFEVRILDMNENELWHAFPGWVTGEVGENSGVENSLEVAVVKRLVAMRYGTAIRVDSGRIIKDWSGPPLTDNLEFNIYPDELNAFDWYIIVQGGGNAHIKIWVNQVATSPYSDPDYTFSAATSAQEIFPNPNPPIRVNHGGIENDPNVDVQLHEDPTLNFLGIKYEPPLGWLRIYVVMVPSCSDWYSATLALETLPATLEVKLWR